MNADQLETLLDAAADAYSPSRRTTGSHPVDVDVDGDAGDVVGASDASDVGGAAGPARDGLEVGLTDAGYYFETPSGRHEGLDEAAFRDVCEENPWYVSNWYFWDAVDRGEADRAFLRWLEDAEESSVPERYEALAEGITRTWGQVLIRAELGGDGHRVYHVRHEDDAGVELATLEVHADPLAARDVVTYDDDGRYRPLKTAPTLPTGWAFTDLDGKALARLVDTVYPATVANWHRERRGELDVNHYRETAERQTGIYDLVDDLPVEAVEWLAEACCVDSQCLKRREWDEDGETPLSVPRGNGEFPCREPCSMVVAAARTWTMLERERTRTYEFELTPGEKAQLEELIDAVADGRADDVREADFSDGANRYRARYLRAKRMEDNGRLCGVPTEPENGGPRDDRSVDGRSEDDRSEDGRSEGGRSEDDQSEAGRSEDDQSEAGRSEDDQSEAGRSVDGGSETNA